MHAVHYFEWNRRLDPCLDSRDSIDKLSTLVVNLHPQIWAETAIMLTCPNLVAVIEKD